MNVQGGSKRRRNIKRETFMKQALEKAASRGSATGYPGQVNCGVWMRRKEILLWKL